MVKCVNSNFRLMKDLNNDIHEILKELQEYFNITKRHKDLCVSELVFQHYKVIKSLD